MKNDSPQPPKAATDGGPAFPRIANLSAEKMDGMTLRQYAAIAAMQGLLAAGRHGLFEENGRTDCTADSIANDAATVADALLDKLAKKEGSNGEQTIDPGKAPAAYELATLQVGAEDIKVVPRDAAKMTVKGPGRRLPLVEVRNNARCFRGSGETVWRHRARVHGQADQVQGGTEWLSRTLSRSTTRASTR